MAGHEGQRVVTSTALLLFVGLLGPPVVWLTTLQLVYGLAAFGCDAERSRLPLHAMEAAALAAIAITTALSWRVLRQSGVRGLVDVDAGGHRSRFLALGGIVLAVQFAVVLLAQELAVVLLAPCP